MKTERRISGYMIRSTGVAVLLWSAIVTLAWAISSPSDIEGRYFILCSDDFNHRKGQFIHQIRIQGRSYELNFKNPDDAKNLIAGRRIKIRGHKSTDSVEVESVTSMS